MNELEELKEIERNLQELRMQISRYEIVSIEKRIEELRVQAAKHGVVLLLSQLDELKLLENNIHKLELKAANYGGIDTPLHISNEIEHTQKRISVIKKLIEDHIGECEHSLEDRIKRYEKLLESRRNRQEHMSNLIVKYRKPVYLILIILIPNIILVWFILLWFMQNYRVGIFNTGTFVSMVIVLSLFVSIYTSIFGIWIYPWYKRALFPKLRTSESIVRTSTNDIDNAS